MDVKHDGCDVIGAGYGWGKRRNILYGKFWPKTIQFARHEEEDGWVDGLVRWGDVLQHHAQQCDGHRPGPTISMIMQAKLWPTFFNKSYFRQKYHPFSMLLAPQGVLLNIWCIVRSSDTGKHLDECWTYSSSECFSRYTTAPSVDTNTIPTSYSYESTSSLQRYYQHKESLFLSMLCNYYCL